MPTIASVSVKYSRKYQIRKDHWVGFEALITMNVSEEEANFTDPDEVAREAFGIARRAVREQAADLRGQNAEVAERRAAPSAPAPPPSAPTPPPSAPAAPAYAPAAPPLRADLPLARTNGHAPPADKPPF